MSDDVINVLVEQVPHKTSPMSLLLMYRLDGAYSEIDDDAMFAAIAEVVRDHDPRR